MGGGASKRKKQQEKDYAAKEEKEKAMKERAKLVEDEFLAYQESLRKEKKKEKKMKKDKTKLNDSPLESIVAHSERKERQPLTDEVNISSKVEIQQPEVTLPPVQILNPQVFEGFSDEFKNNFIDDHSLSQEETKHNREYRYKKIEKVPIYGENKDGDDSTERGLVDKFDVASYSWLNELKANFDQTAAKLGTVNNVNQIRDGDGHLVIAKNRSIAHIKEVNKVHLGKKCLALDISSNRLTEIHFKHVLTRLLYINLSGNLLLSLDGIHCCQSLRGLNASYNLITSLNPLKFLLDLESLILSSNKICNLIDFDEVTQQREDMDPEIKKLLHERKRTKKTVTDNWNPLPPNLKRLDLSFNAHLSSLNGVESMKKLEHIDCSCCSITKLDEGLVELKNLESLVLRKNKIARLSDVTDIFPKLTTLTCINLSGNEFVQHDEIEGKGVYHLSMLDLCQGRLKYLDDRKILETDYKRYDSLKSEIQCEDILAKLQVECSENTQKMKAILDNLAARHRLEEDILRETIRNAAKAEETKYNEYTTFVNEKLREYKIKEQMSTEAVSDIVRNVDKKKSEAPVYVKES